MKDTIQTINRFRNNLITDSIFMMFFIIVFIILLFVLTRKSRPEFSKLYKAWWIVCLMLIIVCIRLLMLIPAYVDVYTDNIKVVEITDYSCSYHSYGLPLSRSRTKVDFTTIDGKRLYGHMIKEFDIPDNGHGYILYSKYSHYILNCDLHE